METCLTHWRFVCVLFMVWIQFMRLSSLIVVQRDVTVYVIPECQFIQNTYVCEDVPNSIPANVTSVVVKAFKGVNLYNKFKNTSWKQVKKLDLKGLHVTRVDAYAFATLSSLMELTLQLPAVQEFQLLAFDRLTNLIKLDLLDMLQIRYQNWLPALNQSLPALETFAFNPGVAPSPPTVAVLTSDADYFFTSKAIKSVSVTNSLIIATDTVFLKVVLSQIDTLNISGSTVELYSRDGECPSNYTDIFSALKKRPLLKTFDISGCKYSEHPFDVYRENGQMCFGQSYIYFIRYMTLIENFYANNMFHEAGAELLLAYNDTVSSVFWKTLSLRQNNITTVTGTLLLNPNNTVFSIDLSDNTIAYIHPDCLSTLLQLRHCNLSKNKLFEMQNNTNDFQLLFHYFTEMKEIDLSYNGISSLPLEMFDANINLEVLNLSFNRLATIMFGLTKLRKLGILDLSGNHIQVVEGRYLSQLQQYIATMQSNSSGVKLILGDNPLLCACNTVTFVDWLAKLSALNNSMNSYYCNYKGERQKVVKAVVDKSKYLCRIETIIIVSVSVPSVLFLVILVVVGMLIKIRRNRIQMNREYQFRNEYYRQDTAEQFMVFLAYASLDEYIVRNHMTIPLNETLKARLETNRNVIATGNNFRPGFRITEKTFRLIKMSHIFIAVISDRFCRSEYCIGELHEACNQRKPVILVFSGEVDENDMSPYLREVFKRVVRAKLVTVENGSIEIIPSIENICESVMILAMAQANM